MPVPTAKDMNGMTTFGTASKARVHSRSRAPMNSPMKNGTRAATSAITGMSARPEAPRNTSARNGPSSKALATYAPRSRSSPYSPVKASHMAPLLLPKMAISPRIEMPPIPLTPTVSPRTTHIVIGISVLASRTTSVVLAAPLPFFVPVIDAPVARISSAIRVRAPSLNRAVVKPPIPSASGTKVFTRTPRASGMIISRQGRDA
jgi:hypothetical protein